MSPLDDAIDLLSAEIAVFNVGTQAAPRPSSPEWYVLRAKTLAVSHLKRMRQLGLDQDQDGRSAEAFYRRTSQTIKGDDLAALLDREALGVQTNI